MDSKLVKIIRLSYLRHLINIRYISIIEPGAVEVFHSSQEFLLFVPLQNLKRLLCSDTAPKYPTSTQNDRATVCDMDFISLI